MKRKHQRRRAKMPSLRVLDLYMKSIIVVVVVIVLINELLIVRHRKVTERKELNLLNPPSERHLKDGTSNKTVKVIPNQTNKEKPSGIKNGNTDKISERSTSKPNLRKTQNPYQMPEQRITQKSSEIPERRITQKPSEIPERRFTQKPSEIPKRRFTQKPYAMSERRSATKLSEMDDQNTDKRNSRPDRIQGYLASLKNTTNNPAVVMQKSPSIYNNRLLPQVFSAANKRTQERTFESFTGGKPLSFKDVTLKQSDQEIKLIALYRLHHPLLRHRLNKLRLDTCMTYKNCKIVSVEAMSHKPIPAHAIIFEGRKIPGVSPKRAHKNQVYTFMDLEPPLYNHKTDLDSRKYRNFFNYSMTYRLDSTIPFLYGSVTHKTVKSAVVAEAFETREVFGHGNVTKYAETLNFFSGPHMTWNKNYSEIFRRKTNAAVWLVSHCNTSSKRETYVEEMQKYINVDIIGKCNESNTHLCPKEGRSTGCEDSLARSYKFYIAFENSFCENYITEKVYHWYARDIITIVRGARHYDNFLPRGTYIDAEKFASPKQLAQYLNLLSKDEKLYTDILKRKDNYKVISMMSRAKMALCNLCHRLNTISRNRNIISDIYKWWDENVCVDLSSLEK